MDWEEVIVDKFVDDLNVFNMIFGGFKGFRYLYKFGIIKKVVFFLEEREIVIVEYIR